MITIKNIVLAALAFGAPGSYLSVSFTTAFATIQDGGFKFPQDPSGTISTMLGSRAGFVDFSEELAKPGVAVVFGTMTKVTEGRRERIEGDLGIGNSKVVNMGTVFYKIESTGEINITEAFFGEVKGKSVTVAFDLQLARLFDGKESRQILSNPKHVFETPLTGIWVLEKEKNKKNYRVSRLDKFDIKAEKSADPDTVMRKRANDRFGINRRKADYVALLDSYNVAKTDKDKGNIAKKLKAALDNKPKWQLVETDSIANGQLAPYEKRAKEAVEEYEKTAGAAEKSGEKPPE
ncbi:MAG: hypothetical protein ACKVS6_13030 [Planctomycetota bacterium]